MTPMILASDTMASHFILIGASLLTGLAIGWWMRAVLNRTCKPGTIKPPFKFKIVDPRTYQLMRENLERDRIA